LLPGVSKCLSSISYMRLINAWLINTISLVVLYTGNLTKNETD